MKIVICSLKVYRLHTFEIISKFFFPTLWREITYKKQFRVKIFWSEIRDFKNLLSKVISIHLLSSKYSSYMDHKKYLFITYTTDLLLENKFKLPSKQFVLVHNIRPIVKEGTEYTYFPTKYLACANIWTWKKWPEFPPCSLSLILAP